MRFFHLTLVACAAVGLFTTACTTPEPPAPAADLAPAAAPAPATDMTDTTRTVVQRHLQTFGAGDLEGVLADYADNAVMYTPNGPLEGKDALREGFKQFIAEWSQPGMKFNLTREEYEGENGYITWTAETAANVYDFGVDGFVVRDGKIVTQFFGARTTPKR